MNILLQLLVQVRILCSLFDQILFCLFRHYFVVYGLLLGSLNLDRVLESRSFYRIILRLVNDEWKPMLITSENIIEAYPQSSLVADEFEAWHLLQLQVCLF